jgi:hypothetical protein
MYTFIIMNFVVAAAMGWCTGTAFAHGNTYTGLIGVVGIVANSLQGQGLN